MAEPSTPGELTPFVAPDGVELYARTWKASGPTKARLLYFHGFSDHVGHTAELFPTLNQAGIEVNGIDQRGFGKSVKKPSDHGDTGGTFQVMADMTNFIKSHLPSDVPLFIAGHSMGGGEVLYWAAHGPKEIVSQVAGILAIAPWISLDPKVEPYSFVVAIGRFVARFLPHFRMKNKLEASHISRDPGSNALWEADELCPQEGTLQMFDGCLNRALELKTGQAIPRSEVKSMWIAHGTNDLITSCPASEAYVKRVNHKDMTLKLYPDAYHALHVDPEHKEQFYQDMIEFMLTRAKAAEPQSKL